MGAGNQRIPIDRIDLFRLARRLGMGKRQIRFTPQPHSKSSRITSVLGVRPRQLSLFPTITIVLNEHNLHSTVLDINQRTIWFSVPFLNHIR
jgi:hypothetical protein